MNAINQKIISISLFKLVLPLFVILFIQVAANAQSYTSEEQNCFEMVQGKVAFDQIGNKTWAEVNVRNLCKGTTNAAQTISCFSSKISAGVDWSVASPACSPTTLQTTSFNLNGTWVTYNDKSVIFDKSATISQSGVNLSINNGYGSNSTAVINGNTFTTSDGLTGRISADGMRINWSNKFVWLKQTSTAANPNPPAVSLNGTWAMYEGNGTKYDKNAVITQNGTSVTLNNGYGSQETVNLESTKLNVRTWKLTGTVSADSTRIDWSNGFYWVKKDSWDRPEVMNTVDNRTLTLRNGGAVNVTINLYDANRKVFDNTPLKSIKWVDGGASPSVNFGAGFPPETALEVEITMKVGGLGGFWDIPIYRAKIAANSSNLCFEVSGTAYKPDAKPCNKTEAVEFDHITLRNEAGFMAKMIFDYTQLTSDTDTAKKTITTDDTLLGFERKLYVPRDRTGNEVTLKINGSGRDLLEKTLQTNAKIADCYKVWGDALFPKVSPCSVSSSARTIKFWNNSGTVARLEVTYDGNKKVSTNNINLATTETIEIPSSTQNAPINLRFVITSEYGDHKVTIPSNFTGELCYKIEGTTKSSAVSTCDGEVGDTFGETRQIRFQNDAGYDAQMIVMYFEDQVINGTTFPMAKTLSTGFINGLGGKFRLVSIPKNTSKGMQITISLQGSTTVKNDMFSTTLPADFVASPQPCFKVTGTLFDPSGGKCNQ